ncbi:PEP-CTERM-box response regulator transcription factor [Virgifigura deserti]|uniref:PEP-CTERM-box response regulator transcription factor n=1 Tax=Virgifigura deserti TaxID=2268457 RepID=UPI003CCBA10B
MNTHNLLLVDDDPAILRMLRWSFENYQVHTASNRAEALRQVAETQPPVVTLDLGLPPMPDDAIEGLATLEQILSTAPDTKVIVVTGNEDRTNAVKAIGLGAYDFYQKPIDAEILSLIVDRAFKLWELEAENRRLKGTGDEAFFGITTASEPMQRVCRSIEKVAPTDASVLLLGESGTGKELLAHALHNLSDRKNAPFIAINCGAIPEALLESELFGHEKGAFTGAIRQVKGKIELAQRGTLFLDEIGDMPMSLQVKLLRFLQERVIERIGGRDQIPVDVRIVCATNRNLHERIAGGQFREDLFYRISEISIDIPPLRARGDDSVVLACHFIEKYGRNDSKRKLKLSAEALAALREYHWPGNVRELENRVKRAVILAETSIIGAADLDLRSTEAANTMPTLREAREKAERSILLDALNSAEGNLSVAAKMLGVSRPTIYSLLKQLNIKWPP